MSNTRASRNVTVKCIISNDMAKRIYLERQIKKLRADMNNYCEVDYAKCMSTWDEIWDLEKVLYAMNDKIRYEYDDNSVLNMYCERFPEAQECKMYDS